MENSILHPKSANVYSPYTIYHLKGTDQPISELTSAAIKA